MFWLDRIFGQIEAERKAKIASGTPLVVRDEKTPSGRVHIGSMRGVAIHGAIAERLAEAGVPHVFKYEFNDTDPMDGFPEYLPESFRQYMGMPLFRIPSPDGVAKNFAEYFADEFKSVITQSGFAPEFYRMSELYLSGQMDDAIRTALDRAADIRRIYREVSGSEKPDDWYPLNVICENCGKVGTTKVFAWDGTEVSYKCYKTAVKWAEGCEHEGKVSPFGGAATFPFKVEWPAKWKVVGVDIEGAGKDHTTKGGARDVAAHIAQEVFAYEVPINAPYEFFLVGGKKMSSSKGQGSSAKEIADLVPAKIFRLALLGKEINQQVNFDPEGDTIPVLYDQYDKLADGYNATQDDDYARLFTYIHANRQVPTFAGELPRFSQVAFVVQMPHMDLDKEFPQADKVELHERAEYAKRWLAKFAPEKFVFKLQEMLPAVELSASEKLNLASFAQFLESNPSASAEDMHTKLHELKAFKEIYKIFLGKESGPKAGWFLASLDRDFVRTRMSEASN